MEMEGKLNNHQTNAKNDKKQHHFVLVHGTGHGAWCWYKLKTLLESAGHAVTAVDLAASGLHPARLHEVESISDYVRPLMEVMAALPSGERVVLVGHSYGGVGISLAVEAFAGKVSAAVFATAIMPGPDFPLLEILVEFFKRNPSGLADSKVFFDQGPENPPTSFVFGPQCLSYLLYQNCSPEDLKLATTMVREAIYFRKEALVLDASVMFSNERHKSVARAYIVCKEDKVLTEEFQRWMIERAPVNEVKEIQGADHMVMLSKPRELFDYLLLVADKYD